MFVELPNALVDAHKSILGYIFGQLFVVCDEVSRLHGFPLVAGNQYFQPADITVFRRRIASRSSMEFSINVGMHTNDTNDLIKRFAFLPFQGYFSPYCVIYTRSQDRLNVF